MTMETDIVRVGVAARVRAMARAKNASQREVARIIGITQPSTNLRMNGDRSFRAEELVMLAFAWDTTIDSFMPEDLVEEVSEQNQLM